ncbi:phosphoribosylanthranilate isomerase [Salidesulfovibrio onnuriiensis]|uniref:phosphoribosylanthranilate isomerase n=1 Tax=Salidesulfovibrio onnuriiensis TaxID=2583823 RepID=UPI001650A56C|nr:phosphoribosylanthranilate isomerase [Salidesulfovibrio onnuriiensis]
MKKPLIKVCGMTRAEDVALCSGLGASFLGFIFHEGSPRNVSPKFAASAQTGPAAKVGVFVRQTANEVRLMIHQCGLDYVQLHGGQDEEFCEVVGRERVVKALWPERYASPEALQEDVDRFAPHCAYLLFDAGVSGGGHGRSIDLSLLQHIEINKPWFLAGGLCPENVAAAAQAGPHVLDLNSGVESAPGIKDEAKLRSVIEILSKQI